MYNKCFLLIALTALFPGTAYTGVYKWTDEKGNVHYSQTRPSSDIKSESLRVHGRAPKDNSTYDKPSLDKPEEEIKKDEKQPVEDKKEDTNKLSKKESKAACLAARKKLTQMQSTGRVRLRDAQGNTSYLSEEQKQAEIKKARNVIKQYCK